MRSICSANYFADDSSPPSRGPAQLQQEPAPGPVPAVLLATQGDAVAGAGLRHTGPSHGTQQNTWFIKTPIYIPKQTI